MQYWKYALIITVLVCSGCYPQQPLAPVPDPTAAVLADPVSATSEESELPSAENTVEVEVGVETGAETVAEAGVRTQEPVAVAPKLVEEATLDPVVEPSALYYSGDIPLTDHARIDKFVDYYTHAGRGTFEVWLERASRYIPNIQEVFAEEEIPLDLAYLALIESGLNMRAYSWAHAAGPWQFIESTGQLYGLTNDWWQDGRLDIEKSTLAAAKHLKYLGNRFEDDWYLAVAAYNAGGGTVNKAITKSGSRDFWVLSQGSVLREETCDYLPKLLATLTIVKDLETYGFAELDFQAPYAFDTVNLESSTDLEVIAGLCGVTYEEIKELNPELKRWCTPPGVENYPIHVPVGTAQKVADLYALLPVDQRARYYRHQIKSGDTLLALAQKYSIRVADIISLNKIVNPRALQIGQDLILPLSEDYSALPVAELADSYKRSSRTAYTVCKGDSLWAIARRFDVSEKELRVWNKLGWSDYLQPGQKLMVSKSSTSTATKIAAASSGQKTKVIYQVVPGDTLWGIGKQFNVATDEILHWNELSREHVLQPGQKLTLMVAVNT
jgi:membrane-bound lytic murein transglycosylase D